MSTSYQRLFFILTMKLFFTSVPILSGQLKMVCLHILFSYLAHIKPILLKSFASNFFAVTNFTVKNSGRLISISVRKVQFLSVPILSGRSVYPARTYYI